MDYDTEYTLFKNWLLQDITKQLTQGKYKDIPYNQRRILVDLTDQIHKLNPPNYVRY
jgi:hypothetical protein